MSCTKYLQYDKTISSITNRFKSFIPHITYTSAIDDRICFTSFITNTKMLRHFSRKLLSGALLLFVPTPDTLKMDHSILHVLDWSVKQASKEFNIKVGATEQPSHPILNDINQKLPVELSIIFRSSWSDSSQEKSAKNWMNILSNNVSNHEIESDLRTISNLGNNLHWENFFWTSKYIKEEGYKTESINSIKYLNKNHGQNEMKYENLVESPEYSDIFNRIRNLPPYFDAMNEIPGVSGSINVEAFQNNAEKWSTLKEKFDRIYSQKAEKDVCSYGGILVQHRKNNIILKLDSNFFQKNHFLDTCFANIIVLLSSDPGVSRIAVSRPMRSLNSKARPIVQSGTTTSEPYSAAGLDGNGVVVGISDTGIDEESCYFLDEKGPVPRSSVDHPVTYPEYRKVIQYVNYSGSNGDYNYGHGSHVSGSIAGASTSTGNQYKGMAPGAKLAFFDIGAKNGELLVPTDLSTYLFPSAHKAGARLHSNSWGGGYWYDSFCIEVDQYLYDNDDFLVFFAGGNDGGLGYHTVLSPALSKNALSVAASYTCSTQINDIVYFSAIGPAPDGRNKPDITAPGLQIVSASAVGEDGERETCGTTSKSGTSMATPISAGNAALVRQYFEDEKFWASLCEPSYPRCSKGSFPPSGPMIKALMIHSGVPMHRYLGQGGRVGTIDLQQPPDIYQGYGRIDLSNILPLTDHKSSDFTLFVEDAVLTPLTEVIHVINIKTVTSPLKVTVTWFDPPNPEFAARVLIHDLDLIITSPNGDVYYGNTHLTSLTPNRDELNNNEQLYITTLNGLKKGNWTIHVQAKMLPSSSSQSFSIVITGDGLVYPHIGM